MQTSHGLMATSLQAHSQSYVTLPKTSQLLAGFWQSQSFQLLLTNNWESFQSRIHVLLEECEGGKLWVCAGVVSAFISFIYFLQEDGKKELCYHGTRIFIWIKLKTCPAVQQTLELRNLKKKKKSTGLEVKGPAFSGWLLERTMEVRKRKK